MVQLPAEGTEGKFITMLVFSPNVHWRCGKQHSKQPNKNKMQLSCSFAEEKFSAQYTFYNGSVSI